ncbi:MAG: S8 family serine peptidase [Synergistaceae bacterium]|nr:S8 family serine peptidase [Synergistaceae bacterium]
MKKRLSLVALLCVSLCAFFAFPALASCPGEVLVLFKKSGTGGRVTAASLKSGGESFRLASAAAASEARVTACYASLSESLGGPLVLLHSDTKSAEELLSELRARPDVAAVCLNSKVYLADEVTPDDARFGELWGMRAINAPGAWAVTTGSDQVYVAVIDSGIATTHPDLAENVDTKFSRNFYASAENDYYAQGDGNIEDQQRHGTHVSGIIGAVGNNGTGVVGVSWRPKIIALKAFGAGQDAYLSYIISALNYLKGVLDANADLNLAAVNLSLVGYSTATPSQVRNEMDEDGYHLLWQALSAVDGTNRAVLVVAAGNAGIEVGVPSPRSGSDYALGSYAYPASMEGLENLIVVGAIREDGTLASFSNYSASKVHLAAPGVNILSTAPYSSVKAGYITIKGTSQAAPHVAGAAALLRSVYPNATASQIKEALLKGASSTEALSGKAAYGLLDVKGALDALAAAQSEPAAEPETPADSGNSGSESTENSDGDSSSEKSASGSGGGGCGAANVPAALWLLVILPCLRRGKK